LADVQPVQQVPSTSSNWLLSDVATAPVKPEQSVNENSTGLPALFDENGMPIINTKGSELGDIINDYFAQPVANAAGTVLEYADKPRGAIAGAIKGIEDNGIAGAWEGAGKGWKENTSFKEVLPDNLINSPVGNALGTAAKTIFAPVGITAVAEPYYNSLPEADKNNLAKSAVGLGLDIALDPLWVVTPAKAVTATKALGKFVGAEKALAPVVSALEKAKKSEQVQAILAKEFELPGWGNITVRRALSEEGPLSGLLDKLKLDKAKLNEQVAEAGKVLEPLTVKQRENVTRMIEAAPDSVTSVSAVMPKSEMDEFFDLVSKSDNVPVKQVLEQRINDWSKIINDTVTEMRSFDKKGSSNIFYNELTGKNERVIKSVNEHPAVQAFVTKNGRMPKADEWYKLAEDYVLRNAPEVNDTRLLAYDAKDYFDR
jgi:hypothetical protein